jgi:hypothetical protein
MFFLLEGWGECFNADLQSNPEEPRAFASVISMIAQRVKARSLYCRCNISVNNLAGKTVNDLAVGRRPKGAFEIFSSRTIPFNVGSCERTFTSPSAPKPLFLQRRSLKTEQFRQAYFSFAYSTLASFRMGMSGSASFQMAKKSW